MPDVEDYRDAALALLPPGRAFSRRPGSWTAKLLEGAMLELRRAARESGWALDKRLPTDHAETVLREWEALFPLVQDETLPEGTLERAARIVRRLRGQSGHDWATWSARAYDAFVLLESVDPAYPQFEAGRSHAGDSLRGDAWMYVFTVRVRPAPGHADEFEAAMARYQRIVDRELKRAHTKVIVAAVEGLTPITTPIDMTLTYLPFELEARMAVTEAVLDYFATLTWGQDIPVDWTASLSLPEGVSCMEVMREPDRPVLAWERWALGNLSLTGGQGG